MLNFGLRRLLLAVPSLLLISATLFGLLHLAPGGPAAVYGASTALTAEQQEQIEHQLGLDRPLAMRYVTWLGRVLRGDLGSSYRDGRPVTHVLVERLPATLLLMGTALILGLMIAVPIALITATTRRRSVRAGIHLFTLLGVSMPTFWTGLLAILIFAGRLGWIPAGGMTTPGGPASVGDLLHHLIAPATVIAVLYASRWGRYLEADVRGVLDEDYVRTARSKGLPEVTVLLGHAFRNSLISIITLVALEFPLMLSGAVVTEVVFSWPGMGRLVTDALTQRDYPVLMGTLVIIAMVVITANLVADFLYSWADPRVRLS